MTISYALLDLAPVPVGATHAESLAQIRDLAIHAESCGYTRFWLAEHHNMPGIASAATAVLVGHVAAATKTMRIGAGGIMLPNHAPLMVAEQFGTLANLYPGRIDLGLGRAPGGDQQTMRALRRNPETSDQFPNDVVELMNYLSDKPTPIAAIPGTGTNIPLWILGSSLNGATLAAQLGLPYAFASHFAPAALGRAIATYRENFRPSVHLDAPHCMMAINVFGADTESDAQLVRSSMTQAFANAQSSNWGPLPEPADNLAAMYPPNVLAGAEATLSVSATGTPAQVQTQLNDLITTYQPDEVILTGNIHNHAARKRSFEIGAQAMDNINAAANTRVKATA